MAHDPYSPCLCGSGKKLKFCCQDILPDMVRVEKLIENQPDAAEKLLRTLLEKHADKEVLVTQLASLLTRRAAHAEARELLVNFLQRNADEPRALLALADICLTTEGFGASRRIVHRAFQLGARQYPAGVAMLASRIAGQMARAGCAMSVREHLALAVRMTPADNRNSMLMQLANFESQRTIPYPFRGRFSLLPVDLDDQALQAEEARARKVSQIGCWEPAAILYTRILEKRPNDSRLWHNLGLFRAWDGRIQEAAEALHKAAALMSADDHDAAVETEALAQLLDLETAQDTYAIVQQTVEIESVSALLTALDNDSRFARIKSSDEDVSEAGERSAGEFEFLSTPLPEPIDPESLPDVVADVTIIDADSDADNSPRALIVALEDDVERATAAFREVAGDLAKDAVDGEEESGELSRMPVPCRLFDWKIHHTDKLGSGKFRDLDQNRLSQALEKWLETPLGALDNQTPLDAAKDADDKIKLAASVLLLDVTCNRMGYDPDLSEIRTKLDIPERAAFKPDDSQSITSLPLLQFGRLAASDLSDDQVIEFTNRVTLVRHLLLLEKAIEELVSRPAAVEKFTPMRAHLLRATVARDKNDLQLASECFAAARDSVNDEPDAFRTKLEIDIRELSCRLDDPEDTELPELLSTIRDRYFKKIPEIEDVIREELANSGCMHLLDQLETAGVTSSGTLWTPDSDKPAAESAGKLWVPGQD